MPKSLTVQSSKIKFKLFINFLGVLNAILLIIFSSLVLTEITKINFSDLKKNVNNFNSAAEAKIIKEACGRSEKNSEECYSKKLADLTNTKSIQEATNTLLELEKIEPQTKGCHIMAHKMSIAAVEKYPNNWKNLLGEIDPLMCTSGFIHGILEAHTRFDPSFKIDGESLEATCQYIVNTSKTDIDPTCSHILGHLLLAQNNGNIESSVEICSEVTEKLRHECYSGVFMENITRHNLEIHGIAERIQWDLEHTRAQEKICLQYKGTESNACWQEVSHMYAALENNHPEKVFGLCSSNAPTQQEKDDCYIHAVAFMPLLPTFNFDNLKLLCKPYENNSLMYIKCFNNVVFFMIISSVDFIEETIDFCNSLNIKHQEACYKKIGTSISKTTSKDKKIELCSRVPEKFREVCKS